MRQPHVLLFDAYAFDPQAGALWVNGVPLTLRPKAATILDHLLRHPGALVTRQELLDAAWPGIAVVDDGLTQCVTDIRQALGPDGPRLLRTVRGRGYILAATVASGALPARTLPSPASAAPSQSRRVWALAVLGAVVLSFPLAALMPRQAPEPRRASRDTQQAAALPRPAPDARFVAHGLVEQGLMIQSGPGAYADRLRESLPLFRRAVATDPNSAAAAAEAAFVHGNLLLIRASTDPTFDRDEATRYADLAMAANANDPLALAARAVALRHTGRYGEALVYYRQAGADPERLSARANVGVMQLLLGNAEAAIEPLRAALVESPRHRFADTWRVYLAIAELLAGRPGFGASLLMTSVPAGAVVSREERMLYRAAALTLDGREEAAREVLAELRRGSPEVLERPLSEHALSQEPAFLALYQERFVAPLTRLGLK